MCLFFGKTAVAQRKAPDCICQSLSAGEGRLQGQIAPGTGRDSFSHVVCSVPAPLGTKESPSDPGIVGEPCAIDSSSSISYAKRSRSSESVQIRTLSEERGEQKPFLPFRSEY
ncbi:hypothetical protein CEXT_196261 [Caerostris extrusa]|uniref:Uncharacterized protein n=1 Tax=Caerostris extrusa TaxID=172846 RepID=A0AAV4VKI6_CAEEX|nr:hypothetical protein CEXT_196261 [Caerostris extrusa]